MANSSNYYDEDSVREEVESPEVLEPSAFEQKMLERVNADFEAAEEYMRPLHEKCVIIYSWYHNAGRYVDLKKENQFPTTFFQEQIDTFASTMLDKLFYKDRPCTLIPVPKTNKPDADVKQDMLQWQDYKDKIRTKMEVFLRDCGQYRFCVAQVDYREKYKRRVVGVDVPVPAIDPNTGEPIMLPDGNLLPSLDPAGQPLMRNELQVINVPEYIGPTVKRIDPTNLFFTEEKKTVDDEHPIMLRIPCSLKYFRDQPYFFNTDRIKEIVKQLPSGDDGRGGHGTSHEQNYSNDKKTIHGMNPTKKTRKREYDYIEWHGRVDKKALYEFLIAEYEGDEDKAESREQMMVELPLIEENEDCQVICGVVEGVVVVRVEETPFEIDTPNIVIGIIQPDEDNLIGTSLGDKLQAVAQGLDVLMGIAIENFKQSVNAGHVINKNALISGSSTIVNTPGFVLETNTDVNAAHKRVEQPRVSPDIYQYQELFKQMGRDASGMANILGGKGEPGAETLGEAEIVSGMASLKVSSYLKSFEDTFIEPLYSMRNEINVQFLDEEYVYGIIGEGAIDWRTASPSQIRTPVNFLCESSTRETNRHLITQQILQLAKLIPIAAAQGIPTRFDKLLQQLVEQGFSWSTERAQDIWPTLKLEKDENDSVDQMMIDTMIGEVTIRRMMTAMGMMGGGMAPQGGMGGPSKEPRSESEATQGLAQSSRTQVGRTI